MKKMMQPMNLCRNMLWSRGNTEAKPNLLITVIECRKMKVRTRTEFTLRHIPKKI